MDDPTNAQGSEEEVMSVFRNVREEIRERILPLLRERYSS